MKVFLSWSGTRSNSMAKALKGWLPLVLHYVEPWFSDKDISAGERWSLEISKKLDETNFGIICLTEDNFHSPWVLFEGGALSKALSDSAVCPYLLGIELRNFTGPLAQFQAKKTDKNSTLEMVQGINKKAPEPIDEPRLRELFEVLWPKLEQRLGEIPKSQIQTGQSTRSQPEILEDLVGTIRDIDRRLGGLEIDVSLLPLTLTSEPVEKRTAPNKSLQLRIDMDGTKYEKGRGIRIGHSMLRPEFLLDISRILGLNSNEFNESWYLLDTNSKTFLTHEQCSDLVGYFGDSVPSVEVTDNMFADIPF